MGLRGERCACSGDGRPERARRKSSSIWFHPKPPAADWPGGNGGGSTDFLALFQADAPWPNAIAHVSVIGMYAGWITAASDEDLQQTVAFLNAHNMGVEIEAPSLQATATCGSGVEGYVPFGLSLHDFTLAYLDRLKALGAQVPFVKVDEPFFFGSVVDDPRSCHFPVSEVASVVGITRDSSRASIRRWQSVTSNRLSRAPTHRMLGLRSSGGTTPTERSPARGSRSSSRTSISAIRRGRRS